MKKFLLIVLMLLSFNSIFSQENNSNAPFSKVGLGVYGGINFENLSVAWGSFNIEGRTNLTSQLNLKFSAGYHRIHSFDSLTINTFKFSNIEDVQKYYSITYEIISTAYIVVPFGIGLQYSFSFNKFNPYLFGDVNYNLIDPVTKKGGEYIVNEYDSYEDIPEKYKYPNILPNNSFGFSAGIGTTYCITKKLGLDLRYYYKYDSEIVNTHHLLVGIVF